MYVGGGVELCMFVLLVLIYSFLVKLASLENIRQSVRAHLLLGSME